MPTITETQRLTAQRAFAQIMPHAETLGLLFYAHLFELDPELRKLFHVDMETQGHTLMTMLQLCMEGLDERTELQFALKNLGARHVTYGVQLRDYAAVEQSLLWTLEQGLGADWNEETARALQAVLELFIAEMQAGAAQPPIAPSDAV